MAKAEALVKSMRAGEAAERLKAIKSVRDGIIGNKAKKKKFLHAGAVPVIAEAMAGAPAGDPALLVACAVTMGSFAAGLDAGAAAVLDAGGLAALLRSMSSTDPAVVVAAVRALNVLCQASRRPASPSPSATGSYRLTWSLSMSTRFTVATRQTLPRCFPFRLGASSAAALACFLLLYGGPAPRQLHILCWSNTFGIDDRPTCVLRAVAAGGRGRHLRLARPAAAGGAAGLCDRRRRRCGREALGAPLCSPGTGAAAALAPYVPQPKSEPGRSVMGSSLSVCTARSWRQPIC